MNDLLPYAELKLDDHILGIESEDQRQIDVSARWHDGKDSYLMIVQVKDLTRRADVNVVGEFKSVIQDVGAHKGVLICSGGFSKTAKTYARNVGISLFALHDAQSRDWSLELTIPIVWVSLEPTVSPALKFVSGVSGNVTIAASEGPILSRDGGATRERMLDLFKDLWNSGVADRSVGKHEMEPGGDWTMPYLDAEGNEHWSKVEDFRFNYLVNRRSWLGQYRPQECRGIVDFLDSDVFLPTYMSLADLPVRRDDTWTEISDPDKVALELRGLIITAEQFQMETGYVHSMRITKLDGEGHAVGSPVVWSPRSGDAQ